MLLLTPHAFLLAARVLVGAQGLDYVFAREPICDWHTYDWIDGHTIVGGPKCDGAHGLTEATYGGQGIFPFPAVGNNCVSDFGKVMVGDVCPADGVDVHHLLRYTCSPHI
jgi:hypothetical protein